MTSLVEPRLPRTLAAIAALTVLVGSTCVKSADAPNSAATDKKIIVPESSKTKPGDRGKKAHTNYLIGNGGKPIVPPTPVPKHPD